MISDMQSSAIDIEQIIRVVIERLAAGRALMEGVVDLAQPASESSELVIQDRVVTTHLVEPHLDGKRSLRVTARAVVTPAVLDLLRTKKIELVRDSQSPLPKASTDRGAAVTADTAAAPAIAAVSPVLVCGSAVWFNSLSRHLCPQQANVQGCDDDAALQRIEAHLSRGGDRAVWLTPRPFAAAVMAQRTSKVAAVQLASLSDLSAALEQAQPQLLIVDAPRWTVAAIGNLVRALVRSR